MDSFTEGLRCQDVNAGLRNIDPSSAVLGTLADTQRVGMAANLASLIRGVDVIEDAQNLRAIAADQLDINTFAFDQVIETLAEADLVTGLKYDGRKLISFNEKVPFYSDLYPRLGEVWRGSKPTELEQQVVLLVEELAKVPVARDDVVDRLGLDASEFDTLLEVSTQSELVQVVKLGKDEILYSPFLGFEKPALISDVIRDHGSAELADALEAVRAQQGTPVSLAGAVIQDAVSRGMLMAPSVIVPGGKTEAFATLPYAIDHDLLRNRKAVLEKALAVIACLRTGQYFGGYSNLSPATLVNAIDKLLRVGSLNPHSSSERQYKLLTRTDVIQLKEDTKPGGNWKVPALIDTHDNRDALSLARDLITHGESLAERSPGQSEASKLLSTNDTYGTPILTVGRMRDKKRLNDKRWQSAIDTLMGHKTA